MKKTALTLTLALTLGACGDGTNPFTKTTPISPVAAAPTTPAVAAPKVPDGIANDLDKLAYNALTQTLTVTGLTQDGTDETNEYVLASIGQEARTTSSGSNYQAYVDGYTTFTRQNDALGRHATAFVASRDGLQAGVVMTGAQFNKFFGGVYYERNGTYVAPTAPAERFDVTYHGTYAAGLNLRGPDTNLKPIVGALDPDIYRPRQTAYIRGLMFVNVDLNDRSIEGEIYNRTAVLDDPSNASDIPGFRGLPDIVLVEGKLETDGTFAGKLENDGKPDITIGEFAGIIGGQNGEALAGGTNLKDFEDGFTDEIEYGVFVLDLCTASDTESVCVNAQP